MEAIEQHTTSGTSAEPNSTPVPMLMTMKGKWMLMLHGQAFLNVLEQSGPRGSDKVFSTNWFMPMAQRSTGAGYLHRAHHAELGAGDCIEALLP